MITFHPTMPFIPLLRALRSPGKKAAENLARLFPQNTTILTDSGRSALAVVLETLNLRGKRILVPAFLCNTLLPVFRAYDITPVFTDLVPGSYKPETNIPKDAYDIVLVVATYGEEPDSAMITAFEHDGKTVIEDYAHVALPVTPTTVVRPRTYSLSKTLPVPNCGLAILPKTTTNLKPLPTARWSLGGIKDACKVWSGFASFVMHIRLLMKQGTATTPPSWFGPRKISRLSARLLSFALINRLPRNPYCLPFSVENPEKIQGVFFKNGIITERIWHPIIVDATSDSHAFPNAKERSAHTLCAPLWHIARDTDKQHFEAALQKVLSEEAAHKRK